MDSIELIPYYLDLDNLYYLPHFSTKLVKIYVFLDIVMLTSNFLFTFSKLVAAFDEKLTLKDVGTLIFFFYTKESIHPKADKKDLQDLRPSQNQELCFVLKVFPTNIQYTCMRNSGYLSWVGINQFNSIFQYSQTLHFPALLMKIMFFLKRNEPNFINNLSMPMRDYLRRYNTRNRGISESWGDCMLAPIALLKDALTLDLVSWLGLEGLNRSLLQRWGTEFRLSIDKCQSFFQKFCLQFRQ